MNAQIRPLVQSDLQPLWLIFREIIETGATYVHDERTTMTDFVEYWISRGGEQWVAEAEGNLLGGYTVRPNHPGRGAHVGTASYIVASRARGRGVGRALGKHSLERARQIGFSAMQFNFVVSTNSAAVKLWKELGFTIVGTLPQVFRHREAGLVDAYVMHRTLDAR